MPDGDSPERVLLDSYPFQSPLKCSRPQPVLFPVLCTPIGPALNRTAAFPGSACPNRRSSRRCTACASGIAQSGTGDDPSSGVLPVLRRSAASSALTGRAPIPRSLPRSASFPLRLPASLDLIPQNLLHPIPFRSPITQQRPPPSCQVPQFTDVSRRDETASTNPCRSNPASHR